MNQKSAASYKDLFGGHINLSISSAARIVSAYPSSAGALLKIAKGLKRSETLRLKNADEGIEVPPLLIVSTTDACNLACTGCYACAHQREEKPELPASTVDNILRESSEMGVSIVMLAGGEPLLSHDWMDALGNHPELLGIVFTNGTLFSNDTVQWFDKHRHIIPALSIEGNRRQTDARRGAGVYDQVSTAMVSLKRTGLPFGVSVTVTSSNIDTVLNEAFINEYIEKGCRLFIFVEYVPIDPDSAPLILSMPEKQKLNDFCNRMAKKYPALFIPFPGNEEEYGGCLAAGRGFVHISATGDVEPCPFAPFSDRNLADVSLKEALSSKLLSEVRNNHHLLKEGEGGCALWNNREWLNDLVSSK